MLLFSVESLAVARMEGEFYHKKNHCMYHVLKKACKNLGSLWVDHHQAHMGISLGWISMKFFYYSNYTAEDRKKNYEAQLINVNYHNESRFPYENPIELFEEIFGNIEDMGQEHTISMVQKVKYMIRKIKCYHESMCMSKMMVGKYKQGMARYSERGEALPKREPIKKMGNSRLAMVIKIGIQMKTILR